MHKTVVITGSTSGIGLAIAHQFAQAAYNIAFNGLESDGAQIAADVANRHKVEYLFSSANMLDRAALRQFVDEVVTRWGRIDVLINNAGIQHVAPIEQFPEEKWDELININLTAPFLLTKAVWPTLKKQQFGRIINVASAHGLVASPFKAAYVAAKHGLIGLTKTSALEGAAHGITCNAICPGYVNTTLVAKQISELSHQRQQPEREIVAEQFLQKHAIKEFVPADSIGALCLFLASEAASTMTGTTLPIDAGWTAQ